MTPFHNMALMSPATTEADVDRHSEVFREALDALTGGWGFGAARAAPSGPGPLRGRPCDGLPRMTTEMTRVGHGGRKPVISRLGTASGQCGFRAAG